MPLSRRTFEIWFPAIILAVKPDIANYQLKTIIIFNLFYVGFMTNVIPKFEQLIFLHNEYIENYQLLPAHRLRR